MLFKITWDEYFNDMPYVTYVTRHALVHVAEDNRSRACHLTALERARFLSRVSAVATIDKVIEPERKMFWLVFAPTLRAMGVIK